MSLLLLVEVAQFKRSSCLSSSVKYLGALDLLTRKGGRCSERNALSATNKGCWLPVADVMVADVVDCGYRKIERYVSTRTYVYVHCSTYMYFLLLHAHARSYARSIAYLSTWPMNNESILTFSSFN